MQCPTCGCHNIPGAIACFQCQGNLAEPAPSRPADFYPPRAKEKGLERGLDRRRRLRSIDDVPIANRIDAAIAPLYIYGRHLRRGFLSLLPGLAQRRNREPRKAATFALGGAVLLGAALLLIRFPISNALGLMFLTLQLSAIADGTVVSIQRETGEPVPIRVSAGLSLVISSMFFGAWMLVTGAGGEFILRARAPGPVGRIFADDTIVVVRPHWDRYLTAGDWILASRGQAAEYGEGRQADLLWLGGDSFEKVLAGPGSRVVLESTVLIVDGRLRDDVSPAPGARPGFDLSRAVVPDDAWLTLQHRWVNGVMFRTLGITRRSEIRGRIVAVTSPPQHRRFIPAEP